MALIQLRNEGARMFKLTTFGIFRERDGERRPFGIDLPTKRRARSSGSPAT